MHQSTVSCHDARHMVALNEVTTSLNIFKTGQQLSLQCVWLSMRRPPRQHLHWAPVRVGVEDAEGQIFGACWRRERNIITRPSLWRRPSYLPSAVTIARSDKLDTTRNYAHIERNSDVAHAQYLWIVTCLCGLLLTWCIQNEYVHIVMQCMRECFWSVLCFYEFILACCPKWVRTQGSSCGACTWQLWDKWSYAGAWTVVDVGVGHWSSLATMCVLECVWIYVCRFLAACVSVSHLCLRLCVWFRESVRESMRVRQCVKREQIIIRSHHKQQICTNLCTHQKNTGHARGSILQVDQKRNELGRRKRSEKTCLYA